MQSMVWQSVFIFAQKCHCCKLEEEQPTHPVTKRLRTWLSEKIIASQNGQFWAIFKSGESVS